MENTQENTQQFTVPHRKALADLLKPCGELRIKAQSKYRKDYDRLRDSFIRETPETKGVPKLIARIEKLKDESELAKSQLAALGFEFDYEGDLRFSDAAPSRLKKSLDKKIEKEVGASGDIDRKFDEATLNIWGAATLEEARNIVAALL